MYKALQDDILDFIRHAQAVSAFFKTYFKVMFVTSIVILIKRIYYSHNLKSNFPVFFSLCIYRTKIQFKQNMAFEDYIYIRVHSPFSYLILRVYNIMPLNVKFSVFQ